MSQSPVTTSSKTFSIQLASTAGIIIGVLLTHWSIILGSVIGGMSLLVLYFQPAMKKLSRVEKVTLAVLFLSAIIKEPTMLFDVISATALIIYFAAKIYREENTTKQTNPA